MMERVDPAVLDQPVEPTDEPNIKHAEALASALNRSAERVQALWFSFLTFTLYLAIATGTTTHRMLLLESELNLPALNIKLPLLGFYILAPLIFVIIHFYVLLNLVLLARTAKSFDDELVRVFPEDGDAREAFRMRIENTLFVQLLVGGWPERHGLNAKFLSSMALITLAVSPLALLLMLEIKFLPYHSEPITWFHRGLLALDLSLVWTLWPGYRSGWGVRLWPRKKRRIAAAGVFSAVVLLYAVAGVTFPDELMYSATNWLHGRTINTVRNGIVPSGRLFWYEWIAPVNVLRLGGEDLIDDTKLTHLTEKKDTSSDAERWVASLSLAGRDLTEARLASADLRHVDLSNAIVNRADLRHAWLTDARLNGAQLQGSFFHGAHFQGASFQRSQLQGSEFYHADVRGASLSMANLQGASLNSAHFEGADLGGAELQGATMDGAYLQGAVIEGALLHGASLNGAHLQGAQLDHAELQGTTLDGANLEGAWLVNAFVWRSDARKAKWKGTFAYNLQPKPATMCDPANACEWTSGDLKHLEKIVESSVPEALDDKMRENAVRRIKRALDPRTPLKGEREIAKIWERASSAPDGYDNVLAEQWRAIGCAAEGAPYVVRGLIRQMDEERPFVENSEEKSKLAGAFLSKDCIGARELSESEFPKLKTIRDSAARSASR